MATFGESGEPASADDLMVKITDAVANSSETDQTALPPLERAVDTDALPKIVDSDGFSALRFSYHGKVVTIAEDRTVHVAESE